MARLVAFLSLSIALSQFSGVLAGPACARKHYAAANCVQLCKSRWGWSGSLMNTDPWGSVMQATDSSPDDVLAKACGSTVATSATASSTVTVSSASVSATNNIAAPVAVQTSSTVKASSATSSFTSIHIPVSSSASSKPVSTAAFAALPSSKPVVISTSAAAAPKAPTTPAAVAPTTTTPEAAATTTTPAAQQTAAAAASSNSGSSSGSTSSSDIQAYLAGHNTIRAQHGASDLTWSDELASKAQQWANGCVFQHSGGSLGAFGENLAAGTGSSYGIAPAIKSWTDEVKDYSSSNPQPSHFTQVVWKGTSQVGCAVQYCDGIFAASFGKAQFYVCEYSAQGNIIGEFAQNVQA